MSVWPIVWAARWIRFAPPPPERGWYEPRSASRDTFAFYRRDIHVDTLPTAAPCRIAADGRYILFFNGQRVGAGPIRSDPSHPTFDEYDLTSLLRAGANTFAILARHYAGPNVHFRPPPKVGDLGFGSILLEAFIGQEVFGTDGSWRAMQAPYTTPDLPWPEGPPPMEILDGQALPRGWMQPGFDESTWNNAAVCAPRGLGVIDARPPAGSFGPPAPRPIAGLAERLIEPVASDGTDTFRADFGAITVGHPIVEVDADPGAIIEVACGEERDPTGRLIVAPRAWSMQYTAAGVAGEQMESFESAGFRYLEARARSGQVRSIRLKARERFYPRAPGAFFRCSDELLNRIWEAGARTVDLCSLDAIVDCPGREQRAWLGDQSVTALASLMSNADSRLARRTVRLHAEGSRADGLLPMVAAGDFTDRPDTLPDFVLHWVAAVRDVWRYTGDESLLTDLLPVAERALAFFERCRGGDGLLANLPGWVFVDWAQTERGQNVAAVDALYALALDAFAVMADAAGALGASSSARDRAARTRESFERYWDEQRGVYVDAATDGKPGRRISQQTNAIAIVAGCAPTHRHAGMLDAVGDPSRLVITRTPGDPGSFIERLGRQWEHPADFDDERNIVAAQPFFAHFLHRALVIAGRQEALLPSIRRWKAMLDRGNGCFEEYWDAAPGLGSRCHAWSATPTFDLPSYVLGVSPSAPGFERVRIAPYLGDLAWAEGAVPTPLGFIHVRVDRDGVAVELPEGMTGTLWWNEKERPLPTTPPTPTPATLPTTERE